MKNISVNESYQQRESNDKISLIDVRTPAEYGSIHADGAINHPMESFNLEQVPFSKDEEIHVICQSGHDTQVVDQMYDVAYKQ